jgi:hypothetical protein
MNELIRPIDEKIVLTSEDTATGGFCSGKFNLNVEDKIYFKLVRKLTGNSKPKPTVKTPVAK